MSFTISWDDGRAVLGAVAHFKAELVGYEGLNYTIQWQQSSDNVNWEDIAGANEEQMDIIATEETNNLFYRVIVFVHVPQEEVPPQEDIPTEAEVSTEE